MKRRSFALFFIFIAVVFGLRSLVDAQTRQLKICVPDYSVGVMPFFIAKQNGYFAQEQIDVEVIAGRGNLCTMGLIAGSFQFTYSPSTFDAMVAGDVKGKVIYVAEKFLLHRFIVAPQIKRFEDLKGKKIAISAFGTLTDMLTREILTRPWTKADAGRHAACKPAVSQCDWPRCIPATCRVLSRVPTSLGSDARWLSESGIHPPPYVSHPLIVKNEILANEKAVTRVRLFERRSKGHLFFGQKPEETLNVIQKVSAHRRSQNGARNL